MDGEKVVMSREEYEEALAYTALHQQALAKLLGERFCRNGSGGTPIPVPFFPLHGAIDLDEAM